MNTKSKNTENTSKKCLVIGSSNLDFFFYVKDIPEKGQTVMSKGSKIITGGKGFNQAYYINKLTPGSTRFITSVGDDLQSKALIQTYKHCRFIEDSDLIVQKEGESGSAFICIDSKGENTIVVNPGANHLFSPEHFEKRIDAFQNSDFLVVQCEINLEALSFCLEYAKQVNPKIKTVMNLSPTPPGPLEGFLNLVDYLVVNKTETEELFQRTGLHSIPEFAQRFEIDYIVATNGSNPVSIFSRETGKIEVVGSENVEKVVDTCGAGDCFLGGMVASLMKGLEVKDAVRVGNRAAAKKIQNYGAQVDIGGFENFVIDFQS